MTGLRARLRYARWAADADLEARRLYGRGHVVPGVWLQAWYGARFGAEEGWDCREAVLEYGKQAGWTRAL